MEHPHWTRLEEIATTMLHEFLDFMDYPDYVESILVDTLDITKEEAEYFGITEKLAEKFEIKLEEE